MSNTVENFLKEISTGDLNKNNITLIISKMTEIEIIDAWNAVLKNRSNSIKSQLITIFMEKFTVDKNICQIKRLINVILECSFEDISVYLYVLENTYKLLNYNERQNIICKIRPLITTKVIAKLLNSNAETTKSLILELLDDYNICDFIDKCMQQLQDNDIIIKNICFIFLQLDISYFVNYNNILLMEKNDNYYVRCCSIELIEKLINNFKLHNNTHDINVLTNILLEKLTDINYHVRYRAILSLSNLIESSTILAHHLNTVIEYMLDRINDKSVIVRKKAILLGSQLILSENNDEAIIQLIQKALIYCINLLEYNLKTDLQDIFTFIKTAYLNNVLNSKIAIEKILNFIYQDDVKDSVISIFKEIIATKENVLFEFINNKVFEDILPYLDIDYKSILTNLKNKKNIYESIYLLRHLKNYKISETTMEELIIFATNKLHDSKNTTELKMNITIYNNILMICMNLQTRVQCYHPIFSTLISNVIKSTFYEPNLITNTINLIYGISKGPDINASKLINSIIKSNSTIKLLDAIGSVCINQYKFIELIERKIKIDLAEDTNKKHDIEETSTISTRIASKKKCSLTIQDTENIEDTPIKKCKKNSIADSTTLKYSELVESLRFQSIEEIEDFFTNIKENDLLFCKSNLLNQLIDFLIINATFKSDGDQDILYTANISMCKCMLSSFKMFDKCFKSIFVPNLCNNQLDSRLRNALIIFLNDLIIYYNSFIDMSLLYNMLENSDTKKNAILVLFNLTTKDIIRLKPTIRYIVKYFHDPDIGEIVQAFIKTMANKKNNICIIFYECFLFDEIDSSILLYLLQFNLSIQDKQKLINKCMNIVTTPIQKNKIQMITEKLKFKE